MTTERIDHAAEARARIARRSGPVGVLSMTVNADRIAEAQVHATLALVEQQRIANIIALTKPQPLADGGSTQLWVFDPITGELRDDVREGLGL